MARPRKALENQIGNLTKQEIEIKKQEEELIKISAKDIKCPTWVKNKLARKEFKRLTSLLEEIDILTELDVTNLANYCNCYARFVELSLELENESLVVEYTNKAKVTNIIENPKFKVQLKLSEELRKLGNELGISLNSRLKFASAKMEKINDGITDDFGDI